MAGAIAHHFNNYLMAVTGNLELAVSDLERNGQPIDNIVNALQGARLAAEVSSLMLTYLGKTPGKHEPLDLSDVCLQCLPIVRATIPERCGGGGGLPSSSPRRQRERQ